jgi:hypothetical protein
MSKKLTVFRYRGKGLGMRAEVVIIATLGKTAQEMMLKWTSENEVDGSTFRLVEQKPFVAKGQVVYGWNGDY